MSDEPTRHDVEAVLAEHVLTSGFDEAGVYWKYACGCSWTGDSDALAPVYRAAALRGDA